MEHVVTFLMSFAVMVGLFFAIGRGMNQLGDILKKADSEQQKQIDELKRELEEVKRKLDEPRT